METVCSQPPLEHRILPVRRDSPACGPAWLCQEVERRRRSCAVEATSSSKQQNPRTAGVLEAGSPRSGDDRLNYGKSGSGRAAAAGGKCSACGAEMASDQRYCLSVASAAADRACRSWTLRHGPGAKEAGQRRRSRFSPNGALIAGVATLLIAMGIGGFIGRQGTTPARMGFRRTGCDGAGPAELLPPHRPRLPRSAKKAAPGSRWRSRFRVERGGRQPKLPPATVARR